jgi:hypothetical protein
MLICEKIYFILIQIYSCLIESANVNDLTFGKIYYLSNIKENWVKSATLCHQYGLEFLTLDNKIEYEAFADMVEQLDMNVFDDWNHIGGVTKTGGTRNEWFWMETGKAIPFDIDFAPNEPNTPNVEQCLAISPKFSNGKSFYHDVQCSTWIHKFMCQKKI